MRRGAALARDSAALPLRRPAWNTAYGLIEETPQSQNQQTQTPEEAPRSSSQEAHLAEVGLWRRPAVDRSCDREVAGHPWAELIPLPMQPARHQEAD
jgi:hypothetical protein